MPGFSSKNQNDQIRTERAVACQRNLEFLEFLEF